MRPNVSTWGFVRPSIRPFVRPSVRPSVWNSFFKFAEIWYFPISIGRKWTGVINNDHVHLHNRQSNHHDIHNYHNDHNKTTKKRRRIFVRQNLFLCRMLAATDLGSANQLTYLVDLPRLGCTWGQRWDLELGLRTHVVVMNIIASSIPFSSF